MELRKILRSMSWIQNNDNTNNAEEKSECNLGCEDCRCNGTSSESNSNPVIYPSNSDILTVTLNELRDFMKNPQVNQIKISDDEKNTELNDEEISDVMSTLLSLQEKYFSDIPLNESMSKKFLWNLPRIVYDAHKHAKEYHDSFALDPLVCLYALLTEDPQWTMGAYFRDIQEIFDAENDNIRTSIETFDELTLDDEYDDEDDDEYDDEVNEDEEHR